jgi:CHAT domain-containing protein/tetratricopeptide (TPR) repeat protein
MSTVTIQPLSRRTAPVSIPRNAWGIPAALLLLCVACAGGTPHGSLSLAGGTGGKAPGGGRPAPARLAVGARIEREIGGAETQELLLELPAAAYARVTAEQNGADVALELRGPDGAVLTRSDGPGGHRVPELLAWITPAVGSYRLLVTPHDRRAPRGVYALALEEARPTVAGDEERVATERAAADARQRSFCEKVEDKRRALEDLRQVLAAWRRLGDAEGEAVALNDLGKLQITLGENQEATALLQQALALARTLRDRREEARALGQLGRVLRRTGGDRAEVLALYEGALRLARELGDGAGEGEVLYNIGVLHADQGDAKTASSYYQQALTVQEAAGVLAPQALSLAAIGLVARDQGDAARALDCFNRGLELARGSGEGSTQAYLLYSTASFHLRRGEMQRAIELFTEALDLYRAQGDRTQEARVLMNLGSANSNLGDLDRALDDYQKALDLHREGGDRDGEVIALLYQGAVLQVRGDTAGAVARFTTALETARATGYTPGLAQALLDLGRAELALGHAAEGVRWLEEALALNEKIGNTLGRAMTLIKLGSAAHTLGDDTRAAGQLREALDLGRGMQYFVVECGALAALARLERDRGDLPAARAAIEEALHLVDSVRSKVASQQLRVSFLASRQADYALHLDILMRLHAADPAGGYLPAALASSEQARARGLLDLLAEGRIDVRRGIAEDLKQREDEIDGRISAYQTQMLADLSAGTWDGVKATRLEGEMKQAAEDREELDWEIRRRNPRYAAVRNPSPLRPEEVQALLDERTAFLEYAVGEERSYLFVVTREGLTSYTLPPAARLAEEVRRIGSGLEKPGRRGFGVYVDVARELYRELLTPAGAVLAGKTHLVVAPDGPLHFLSFEALLTRDPGAAQGFAELPYLIGDKSVTYVPSASVLAELAEPRQRAAASSGAPGAPSGAEPLQFVGFADPVPAVAGGAGAAGAPGGGLVARAGLRDGSLAAALPGLGRLAQSRREVAGIAGLYGPGAARLYLDGEATEENVKDNELLRHARRIHFATHGLLDEKQPELSGLLLSRGAGSREDGLLQVYEIFNLQLDADLVVLSACDTGLGTMVSGEGLVGVTRALLYAGARSVVVSLWQVDDASTPDLMAGFYRHLDQDADKTESLRLAKLEMIRQGRFSHPYYWAPFILIGEPR